MTTQNNETAFQQILGKKCNIECNFNIDKISRKPKGTKETKGFCNGTYKEFLKETGLDQLGSNYFSGTWDDFEKVIGTEDKWYYDFSTEQLMAVYDYWSEHIYEPEQLLILRAGISDELNRSYDDNDNFIDVVDKAVEILKNN